MLWPIAVGWYGVALLTRLYTNGDRWPLRLLVTIGAGTVVMSVLRGGFTDRPWVSIFTVIFVAWMLATTFGWRWITHAITARRSARADRSPLHVDRERGRARHPTRSSLVASMALTLTAHVTG